MKQSPLTLLKHYLALLYKYKVVEVFANPQTHRRELVFLLGIFFIILTIIICFLLLLYFRIKTPPKIGPVTPAEKIKRRKRRLLKASVPVLAILVLLGFGSYRSMQLDFCKRCHVLEPELSSRQSSAHPDVSCTTCHIKSGITGYFSNRFRGLDNALTYLKGKSPKKLKAKVDNSPCLDCHSALTNKPVISKSIRISHKELVSAGYRCTDCHTNTGHTKPALIQRFRGMSACLPCHDGKKASNNCKLCHANEVGVAMRQLKHFDKVYLDEALFTDCRRCHTNQDRCIRCHGVELPHPKDWMPYELSEETGITGPILHARAAAFEKKQLCWKCHQPAACGPCHLRFDSHSPDWKFRHGGSTQASSAQVEKGCKSCHNKAEKFCVLCHAKR